MEDEIKRLKVELDAKNKEIEKLKGIVTQEDCHKADDSILENRDRKPEKLDNRSILRYSRQLILPEIGVEGQLSLQNSSVLIVGAGGLGCPAAIYLAAAGIGRIGLVDYDEVELSNLHRQILHTEGRIGVQKSVSAAHACKSLNNDVCCIPYHMSLDSTNALQLISQYDIVLDATDNVATRYLLNDACILTKKPLVSGSALRFEGQLTVYNYKGGPCYRCLYPKPPPPETVTNCSDGGVLGVVPGIIGCIQALEAIKIAAKIEPAYSQKLLLFDALDGTFRPIRLRPRQTSCLVCGDNPEITRLVDYEQFCGTKATDKSHNVSLLHAEERITVQEYKEEQQSRHILIDVRQPVELDICKLPNSTNIPIDKIDKEQSLQALRDLMCTEASGEPDHSKVFVVCRRGNDSQAAVQKLKKVLNDDKIVIKDIKGGLTAWSRHIDNEFPIY